MIDSGTYKAFKNYMALNDNGWAYGNSILYDMCEENPLHNNADIIVAKIWLIGRSYAAAIERRKIALDYKGDYYYDIVAPKLLEIGPELDDRIADLKNNNGQISDNFGKLLSTHRFLMDAFYALTGLEKRSLAAKYLHFHCPEKVFIYDSIASQRIRKYVKRPDKKRLKGLTDYDEEYAIFVCRLLELQQELFKHDGVYYSPRIIDNFLLRNRG